MAEHDDSYKYLQTPRAALLSAHSDMPLERAKLRCAARRHVCMVAPNLIYVGIPDPDAEGLVVQVVECAIFHVTSIESIDGKPNESYGRRRKTK